MAATQTSKSAKIRARLDHPVLDADGHHLELSPVLLDSMKQVGGHRMAGKIEAELKAGFFSGMGAALGRWIAMPEKERWDTWTTQPNWWNTPTNTMTRATASLPQLFYERMDETGIDFSVVYPTAGLSCYDNVEDPDLMRLACRGHNTYSAELFGPYWKRMTPVAVIPMRTPQDAVEELEYAVRVLGLKAVMMSAVRRPIPALQRKYPDAARLAYRWDTFGIDSEYDYDPVWAKCAELKVSPTFHWAALFGQDVRQSMSNFVYSRIGHFAEAGEAMAKSLFLNGVTRRFPTLKFAFLEGGVAWASSLYANLISHWEKRNPTALDRDVNPANLDPDLMVQLVQQYGDPKMVEGKSQELRDFYAEVRRSPAPDQRDDYIRCQAETAEDIRDLFIPSFYFGCEGDDPMNATAFNTKVNPFGARLGAVLGSDIGHFDVPDMTKVLAEAYELVERGAMTGEDFRDFVFTNAVTLYANLNPDFFKGTQVEEQAAKVLQQRTRGG